MKEGNFAKEEKEKQKESAWVLCVTCFPLPKELRRVAAMVSMAIFCGSKYDIRAAVRLQGT